MPPKKIRLLDLLLKFDSTLSRERAFALIMAGSVKVDGGIYRDPKQLFLVEASIEIILDKYVSRGGYKLEAALSEFNINCKDKVVLDAGASTGGFTDCLLQRGARLVYSVDVGSNQLHSKLRLDGRVVVMEKTNIKDVKRLDPMPEFAVADLSFRSIVPVLKHLVSLTSENQLLLLLKPQFEVELNDVDHSNGIINDPKIHASVIENFYNSAIEMGIAILGAIASPIRGGYGNQEFLILVEDNFSAKIESISLSHLLKDCKL